MRLVDVTVAGIGDYSHAGPVTSSYTGPNAEPPPRPNPDPPPRPNPDPPPRPNPDPPPRPNPDPPPWPNPDPAVCPAPASSLPGCGGKQTLTSEVLWAMHCVESHYSFHSYEELWICLISCFQATMLQRHSLAGETKCRYLCQFGPAQRSQQQ